MAEIDAEARDFARRTSWAAPITDTHSFGAMTLLAASDYVRTYADSIDADGTPVYGHLVVARSALEACVISAWLNEPGIQPADRVKRGLCEQLYNSMELVRLNIEDNARQRVDAWKADAVTLCWPVTTNRDKPVVDGIQRPSIPRSRQPSTLSMRISRGSSRSSASRSSITLSPTRGRADADNEGQAAGCLRLLPRDPGRPLRITQCLGVARVQRAASGSGCIAASR